MLIFSQEGEVEVLSPQCSLNITTFPKFGGIGGTAAMTDEEILLLRNDDMGVSKRYLSIQKPSGGLLAMKYTVEDLPLTQSAHEHSSLVSGNTLTVLGGKFKSRGRLSKFTWTELSLKWEDGTKYIPAFIAACSVKVGTDLHIVIGGNKKVDGEEVSTRQVVKIDTTKEIAYELNPIMKSRVFHSCQLLKNNMILVTGGLPKKGGDPSEVLPDEQYDIESQDIKILDSADSVGRFQHSLARIGDRLLALGGRDASGGVPSKIKEFAPATNSWKELSQELHSSNTTQLAITPIPATAIDCPSECSCGVANKEGRIFAGSEAEVRVMLSSLKPLQVDSLPWIGVLLRDQDRTADYINSHCSVVLVSWWLTSHTCSLLPSDWHQVCAHCGALSLRRWRGPG